MSKSNPEDEGDSHRRSDRQGPITLDETNSDLLREMRKEMDELRNAIKGKWTEAWIGWSGRQTRLLLRWSWNALYRRSFDCLSLSHSTG